MKQIQAMSQIELAAFVQSHLRDAGIEVVLSGGASVAFHSAGKYVSLDIDLVARYHASHADIAAVMKSLGFVEKGRYFLHPENKHLVEFPAGPLSVGREPVKDIDSHDLETGTLRVISPTDCIKDRLLAYFHWNDNQSLAQAALIAKMNRIDWGELERWAGVENIQSEYTSVLGRLRN